MTDENGLPQSPRKPKYLEWVISHGAALLALLGLVTYGILRLNYSIFYGRLGVTPEDVGLGYATTLSQSVVGLLLLLVILFFLMAFAILVFFVTYQTSPEKLAEIFGNAFGTVDATTTTSQESEAPAKQYSFARRGLWIAVRLVMTLTLLGLFYFAIRGGLFTPEGDLNPYGVAALLALVLLFSRQTMEVAREVAQREVLVELWQRYRRPLLYILIAAAVLMLIWLPRQAIQDADRAKKGQVSHISLLGIPLLSWGGDTAVLTWLEGTPPDNLDLGRTRCLIYLGEANSTTVLYDVSNEHPFRLPSGKIGVSLGSKDSACPNRVQPTSS